MKKWWIVLLTLLVFGCSDPFSPTVENVAGTYELVSINNDAVPVVIEKGFYPGIIDGGALVLVEGYYTIALHICSPNFICLYSTVSAGRYEVRNTRLIFKELETGGTVIGRFTGDVTSAEWPDMIASADYLTLHWLGVDWHFTRVRL